MEPSANTASMDSYESADVRIYGVSIGLVHDRILGPIAELSDEFPFHGILYCGFKSAFEELRRPTERLWYFRKDVVRQTGEVEDFRYESVNVSYFDLPLDTSVYEKFYREISLSTEASAANEIFARKIARTPATRLDPEDIRGMSRAALETLVSATLEGDPPQGLIGAEAAPGSEALRARPTPTLRQTRRETRYDPWYKSDKKGGDSD